MVVVRPMHQQLISLTCDRECELFQCPFGQGTGAVVSSLGRESGYRVDHQPCTDGTSSPCVLLLHSDTFGIVSYFSSSMLLDYGKICSQHSFVAL